MQIMEFGERTKPNLVLVTKQFGTELASGAWTVEEATIRLSETLMTIGCDADLIADDLTKLSDEATDELLDPTSSFIPRFVKVATRGIIFREDPDDEPLLDRQPEIPVDLTIEKALSNSIEGVLWFDPEQEKWRDKMTTQSAKLLRALIDGMNESGYSKTAIKDVMREEIETHLDYLATRTSYAAAGLMPVIATIMAKARLNNLSTTIHWAKRTRTMWQTFHG
jgi:hypothetical protein